MSRYEKFLMGIAVVGAMSIAGTAHAQYFGPISPSNPPAAAFPTTGNYPVYPQPPIYYTNPNGVAGVTGGGSAVWDPYRGWVTSTNNTTVLNSATSPGRAPAPGSSIQYYNYWNGTQWVRGSRWLGQDGLWHGEDANTVFRPNGGSDTQQRFYSPAPRGTGGAYRGR
jgi:hypothetical protein